jgi:hypothetical protein
VVDIIEGSIPKDYDLSYISQECIVKLGLVYSHETKTAKTFKKGDITIQLLKTVKEDFDFKISQTTLGVNYKKEMNLTIDKISFENKILIPTDKAWTEKRNALNSLRRIIHWKNKGYSINDMTYLSLLNVVGKSEYKNS